MSALLLLLACRAQPLARFEGAQQLSGSASSELLVGTAAGEVWAVDAFGGHRLLATALGEGVVKLTANPLGTWWALLEGGALVRGTLWSPAEEVGQGIRGAVVDCSGLVVGTEEDPGLWTDEVRAVALASCGTFYIGTVDGRVDGEQVAGAAIRRILPTPAGLGWVAADGTASCPGYDLPSVGVVDAWLSYEQPWIPGEIVWLDGEGRLWVR